MLDKYTAVRSRYFVARIALERSASYSACELIESFKRVHGRSSDGRHEGARPSRVWGRGVHPLPVYFLNFQVKSAGFYAFQCEKNACDQKPGPREA